MNWGNVFQSLGRRQHALGRDGILLLLWALTSAIVIIATISLSWQTANQLVRHELQSAALDWASYLVDSVHDLEQVMATGKVPENSLDVLQSASRLGRVFRYQLFDPKGRLVYTSDMDGNLIDEGPIDEPRPTLHHVLAAKKPIVELRESGTQVDADERIPALYGQVYLPIVTAKGVHGMVEVSLDQTEKATQYRHEFVSFATGLTLLILFAMILPLTMVWRKTKQRELAERKLHDMAHTDPLTKLSNRTNFRDRLDQALYETRTGKRTIALFWLDLDRFKTINDALGHPVGDALLCQVAQRLRRTIASEDVVARLGGDEFAIVVMNCMEQRQASILAEQLIHALAVPFDVEGHHVFIGVSIGVVFAPFDGDHVDALLKKADIALYRAKDAGRSTYRFFQPDMEAKSEVRHALEEDLRQAIHAHQLRLHYQSQVCMKTGEVIGFEALLRWHHPRFGHMPPGEVIALAEETGLIMPLGYWALAQACADATTWPEPIRVSVNISAVQFSHTNLVDLVSEALRTSGLAPARLDLEITESIVMDEDKSTLAKLRKLRRLGVQLSMDDFGTGYSSLSRLRHLPFDNLKIDRSFIKELAGNKSDIAIVQAILALGQNLGMKVIAEGVETDAQRAQLRKEGCDIAQGFYFGRPIPANEIGRQLARYRSHIAMAGRHLNQGKVVPVRRFSKADEAGPSRALKEAVG